MISPRFYYWTNASPSTRPYDVRTSSNMNYYISFWNLNYQYVVGRLKPSPGSGMNWAYVPEKNWIVMSPDPGSAIAKQQYAKAKGLGGNFMFHLGQDVLCKTHRFFSPLRTQPQDSHADFFHYNK